MAVSGCRGLVSLSGSTRSAGVTGVSVGLVVNHL